LLLPTDQILFLHEFIIRREFPSFVTLNKDDPGYGIYFGIHIFNLISVCTAKFKKVSNDQVLYKMTLPKGFGPGGRRVEGGGSRDDDVEKMIGRRVENFRGILILGFALCWAATAGGVYVGVTVYPWAYPLPSGIYALSVLTVIEALGFFWMWKIATEKPLRPY
jgi:hypothetical protein